MKCDDDPHSAHDIDQTLPQINSKELKPIPGTQVTDLIALVH